MQFRIFKDKKQKKRIERWFGRQWVNLTMLFTRFLTLQRARLFGRILGNLGFYLVLRHRRGAIHNINLIYGREKSKKELQQMARSTFIHASCFGWEMLYLYAHGLAKGKPQNLVKTVEGLQHLKTAFGRGRGVIGLTAHLGNFTLLGSKLNSLGIPNTAIMRQLKDQKLEKLLSTIRGDFKQQWIPKLPVSRAIRESIAWLRQGRLLMLYMDQRSGRGIKVDFMGIPTYTPTGAAVFALKTEAAVLPIVNVQDTSGYYKLIIGEEIPVIRTGRHKQDVAANTLRFNQAIERYIRLYPDQWFWFHNRWKGEIIKEGQ